LLLKALPVRRLQARQWQTETRTGSPSQIAASWPQEHWARRRVMTVSSSGSGEHTSAGGLKPEIGPQVAP
jgi:hypothetical protein